MAPGAALRGVSAALVTPLWLHGDRWRSLLGSAESAPAPAGADSSASDDAVRASRHALLWMARVPGHLWRNTCLYRSVAECLVLRRYGVDARLRIGVGREHQGEDGIVAHAWVLRPGQADASADPRADTLRLMDGRS